MRTENLTRIRGMIVSLNIYIYIYMNTRNDRLENKNI